MVAIVTEATEAQSRKTLIVDMLGADIAYYNGEDRGVFMMASSS